VATCHICPPDDNTVPDREMVDHLRVLHPDLYGDGPPRWPDGSIVFVDYTLEPDNFAETKP